MRRKEEEKRQEEEDDEDDYEFVTDMTLNDLIGRRADDDDDDDNDCSDWVVVRPEDCRRTVRARSWRC